MIDPVCSLSNIILSTEKFLWENIALPNNELLINKEDYSARKEELIAAGSGILWNMSNNSRSHHWSAIIHAGVTCYKDFGNKKLYKLTDEIKYQFDKYSLIPVYDYSDETNLVEVNRLVIMGPINWLPIVTEDSGFKTSILSAVVKYAQTGYR